MRVPLLLISALLVTTAGNAQVLNHVSAPARDGVRLSAIAGGLDLSGDGVPDIVVGQDRSNVYGRVAALSGTDGSLLWRKTEDHSGFGSSVAMIRDVNGDGRHDVLVGWPGVNRVVCLSGLDGSEIWSGTAGHSSGSYALNALDTIGDMNSDGIEDVLVGDYAGESGHGVVHLRSGADGALLDLYIGHLGLDSGFGTSVCGLDDVTGDGVPDILVGGGWSLEPGFFVIVSGSNGDYLVTVADPFGPTDYSRFGSSLADLGDLTGDGLSEFAVSAPGAPGPSGPGSGAIYVYEGGTGALLQTLDTGDTRGDAVESLGHTLDGGQDVNGDGVPDLIAGTRASCTGDRSGSVVVFSGADWSVLFEYDGDREEDYLGDAVAHLGDLNGDGIGDFGATANAQTGRPYVRSWAGGDPFTLSPPTPGHVEVPNTVTCTGATPGAVLHLYASFKAGRTRVPCSAGVTVASMFDAQLVRTAVADAAGTATFTVEPPLETHFRRGMLQVVEPASCRLTNVGSARMTYP